MKASEYLIGNGWRPSPSTKADDGAWEHPVLCRVPRGIFKLYSDGERRMPTGHAVSMQLFAERQSDDDLAARAFRVSDIATELGHAFVRRLP